MFVTLNVVNVSKNGSQIRAEHWKNLNWDLFGQENSCLNMYEYNVYLWIFHWTFFWKNFLLPLLHGNCSGPFFRGDFHFRFRVRHIDYFLFILFLWLNYWNFLESFSLYIFSSSSPFNSNDFIQFCVSLLSHNHRYFKYVSISMHKQNYFFLVHFSLFEFHLWNTKIFSNIFFVFLSFSVIFFYHVILVWCTERNNNVNSFYKFKKKIISIDTVFPKPYQIYRNCFTFQCDVPLNERKSKNRMHKNDKFSIFHQTNQRIFIRSIKLK